MTGEEIVDAWMDDELLPEHECTMDVWMVRTVLDKPEQIVRPLDRKQRRIVFRMMQLQQLGPEEALRRATEYEVRCAGV
jgi:hypothetical protein